MKESATEIQPLEDSEGKIANNEDIDFYKITLPYESEFGVSSFLGNDY